MLRAHQIALFQDEAPGMDVANDPHASPELLQGIVDTFCGSQSLFPGDEAGYYLAARDAALHPNTPLIALIKLAAYFPWQVSSNPSLDLALVMGELDLESLPSNTGLYNLVPTRNISPALLGLLERHWVNGIRTMGSALRLAQHPDLSLEVITEGLKAARYTNVASARDAFAYHRNNPDQPPSADPYTRRELLRSIRNNRNNTFEALAYLAAGELISLDVIEEYEAHGDPPSDWLHRNIGVVTRAHHPAAEHHDREKARQQLRSADIQASVDRWHHPALPPENLTHLVAIRASTVLPFLALSGGQPDEITKALLIRPEPMVRAALAHSGNIPEWAHRALLDDTNARVRATAEQLQPA